MSNIHFTFQIFSQYKYITPYEILAYMKNFLANFSWASVKYVFVDRREHKSPYSDIHLPKCHATKMHLRILLNYTGSKFFDDTVIEL